MVGELPPWYGLVKAARYLGTTPWGLLEREDTEMWQEMAWTAEGAEAAAGNEKRKRWPRRR